MSDRLVRVVLSASDLELFEMPMPANWRTIAVALGVHAHETRRRPRVLTYDQARAFAWTNQALAKPSHWS